MSTTKKIKRRLNGVLLLDKALNVTSNTALQQVRRLYNAEKAGHTGVLDPLATGLLPVCFGEATKFAQYLLDADKAYLANLKLGERTSTADAEGEVIATAAFSHINEEAWLKNQNALTTTIEQVPPMHSALKHQGKALYEYARAGIEIERKARTITIHEMKLLRFALPEIDVAVRCSKGTYIRVLAEDLAKGVGTEAHLIGLRRTDTAGFNISQSYDFATLSEYTEAERDALLLPCDVLVQHLPKITLDNKQITLLQYGQRVQFQASYEIISPLRVYSEDNTFIGLVNFEAHKDNLGTLKALRLMATQS